MLSAIKSDKIILEDRIFDGYVCYDGGVITDVTPSTPKDAEIFDFTGKYVCPGFIESHTHGAGGKGYFGGTAEDYAEATTVHLKHGATTVYPTLVACSFEDMLLFLKNAKEMIDARLCAANIPGVHLEGPYLNAAQCGGQAPKFITPPIEEEYKQIIHDYGAYVKRWTYAPENDEGNAFVDYLEKNNILPSIGHSNAVGDEVKRAARGGARLVTHLYSCCSTVTRDHGFRSLGVIESAFLLDELYAEIIADGKHLPPDLIKMILKIKGTDRVILTTDSIDVAATDAPEGSYGETHYIIEDGVAKLYDRSAFAGSIATCDRLIRTLTEECGVGIVEAVKMLTKNPATLLGLNKGEIKQGKDADLIIFDDKIQVSDVFVMGKKVI